jgi:hypothetical protein
MKVRRVIFLLIVAVACLVLLTSCYYIDYYLSQVYKVYGKVTVAGTNSPTPLCSVEVFMGDYQYSELTNYNGDYEMELPEGTWTINFYKDDYEPASAEVTVGPDNPRVEVNVVLEPIAQDIVGVWFGVDQDFISDIPTVDLRQIYGEIYGASGYYENQVYGPGEEPDTKELYYFASTKGTYYVDDGTIFVKVTDYGVDVDPETGKIIWTPFSPQPDEYSALYEIIGDVLTIWLDMSGWGGKEDTCWELTREQ